MVMHCNSHALASIQNRSLGTIVIPRRKDLQLNFHTSEKLLTSTANINKIENKMPKPKSFLKEPKLKKKTAQQVKPTNALW